MSKAYTLQELLIIAVAREIRDYENVILGVGLPTTAGGVGEGVVCATCDVDDGVGDNRF